MKKFFFLAATLCCVAMLNAQEIGTWSGFRESAVSFTFDDGAPSHFTHAAPLFEQYGYRASFYPVVNWHPDWEAFKALADKGHEVGSHSITHGQNMNGEEAASKDSIELYIGHPCLTVAYPNCNVPNSTAVMQNYIAGRICDGSWQGMNDYMGKDGPSDWSKVPAMVTGSMGNIHSYSDFVYQMQTNIGRGGWIAFTTWGFTGEINNGDVTISPTDLYAIEEALEWANERDEDVWVAPLCDVAMYIKERKACTFEEIASDATSRTYSLTHSIADDVCDYQFPLSLRVPDNGWTDVEVLLRGVKLASKLAGGYVYFDAVPNVGYIEVRISTGTAIDNVYAEPAASKLIEDGKLFIIRGENTYNITGQLVK
ncbi:MAG: polysaccharide deacetylase family protein [Paludibacteraceae bacterium]|nr:polysaccharide deacetylase family protein [Paludibacteraceae bacterium]